MAIDLKKMADKIKSAKDTIKVYTIKRTSGVDRDNDIYFDDDKEILDEYVQKEGNKDYILQLQLPVEPWIGNTINPKVIILTGNPRFDYPKPFATPYDRYASRMSTSMSTKVFDDYKEILAKQVAMDGVETNNYLTHQFSLNTNDPVFLADSYKNKSGKPELYWNAKLSSLISDVNAAGMVSDVEKKIAVYEVHGYHSHNFENFPGDKLLPSQQFAIESIQRLAKKNPIFILFRAEEYWKKHLGDILLQASINDRLYKLSSVQNSTISQNNVIKYTPDLWIKEEALKIEKEKCKKGAFTDLVSKIK